MQLDPKVLMTIKDLPLLAKTVINGFLNGYNKSTVKGPGLEFSQYRSYQPGDDLRWLDWRMFARSDRYYIRESEVETNIAVKFLLDASASMAHDDGGVTKIDYARFLCASLAYLANLQGDAIGLSVLQSGKLNTLPQRSDPQHLNRLLYMLSQTEAKGAFAQPDHYKELFSGSATRQLLVFVTDMYQSADEISTLIAKLSALKHEIIVFILMAKNELEFDFKGYSALEDLETGEVIPINTVQTKKEYQEKLEQHLAAIKTELLGKHIAFSIVNTSEPLDKALRDFLVRRNKGY